MGSGISAKEVKQTVTNESYNIKKEIIANKCNFLMSRTYPMSKSSGAIAVNLTTDIKTNLSSQYHKILTKVQEFVDQAPECLDENSQISRWDSYLTLNEIKLQANGWIFGQKGERLSPNYKNQLSICCVIGVWYNEEDKKEEVPNEAEIKRRKKRRKQDILKVLKAVDNESSAVSQDLKTAGCQIVKNVCFNMTDYPREIAGKLISNIEECVILTDANRMWLSQQIIHAVSSARVGLSPAETISKKDASGSIAADDMNLKVDIYSFVYAINGATLNEPEKNLIIRFVVGVFQEDQKGQKMKDYFVNLLMSKT